MSNYPQFLAKTSKGYAVVPQTDKFMKEGTMFALYYDDPILDNNIYDIMQVKRSFANVLEQDVVEKFNSKKEALEFKERAERAGFLDLILHDNEIQYSRILFKKYSLPVYYVNKYGFAVYTFQKKDFLISNIEDVELAKKKRKAVLEALEIIEYIDNVNEQLFEKQLGLAFIQNDTKGMFNYLDLDSNRYVRIDGLNSYADSYVIFDKNSILEKVDDKRIAEIEVFDIELYNFLFCNLSRVEKKLGIACLSIKNVTV